MTNTLDFPKIKHLQDEIQILLKQKPHLQALQDEINERLSTAGSQHNRIAILQAMMYKSVRELLESLQTLKTDINK